VAVAARAETRRTANPFITPASAPSREAGDVAADDLWDDELHLEGPRSPALAPTVRVADEATWPVTKIVERPRLCVMGLHGGAGATTVAGLLGADALDVGSSWPVAEGWERPLPTLAVVVVARTHLVGISAAERLARLWAADTLSRSRLLGLVLVDDAPKLLPSQREAARRLARMTPHGWHIGWHDRWRIEAPALSTASLRTRQVIKNLRAVARETEGEK
jgi:hypothetical protein